jgi:hypothetical protein
MRPAAASKELAGGHIDRGHRGARRREDDGSGMMEWEIVSWISL